MLESFDTAVFVPGRGLYAFADDLVWRYGGHRRHPDPGFPKPITAEFPGAFARSLDAAAVNPEGGLYLFRGDQHMRYDLARRRPEPGYPRGYAGDWPGVFEGAGIDAAVTGAPDIVYVFSGDRYTSFSPRRARVRSGFPKPIAGNWPGLDRGPLRAALALPGGRLVLIGPTRAMVYDGDGHPRDQELELPLRIDPANGSSGDPGPAALHSRRFRESPARADLEAVAAGRLRLGRRGDPEYPAPIRNSGPVVRELQAALIDLGYRLPHGADGRYGNETYQGVLAYKRKHNIRTDSGYLDGIVGPKTIAHIDAALPLPPCPPSRPPSGALAEAGAVGAEAEVPGLTCSLPDVPPPAPRVPLFPIAVAPVLTVDSKLQTALTSAITAVETRHRLTPGSFPIPFAIAEVTAARPFAFAGHRENEMDYIASEAKVQVMFAAYALRDLARRFATARGITAPADLFTQLARDVTPLLRSGVPRIAAATNITDRHRDPSYAAALIATVNATGPVSVEFTSAFRADLERMIVVSDNSAAGRSVRAVGYAYLNGVLQACGLFDATNDRGLWEAADFHGGDPPFTATRWPSVRVPVANDRDVGQAGTARSMVELVSLIAAKLIIDPTACDEMLGHLHRAAVRPTQVDRVFAREPGILRRDAITHNKIGIGPLNAGPDAGLSVFSEVSILDGPVAPGRRYVVAWQNFVDRDGSASHHRPRAFIDEATIIRDTITEYERPVPPTTGTEAEHAGDYPALEWAGADGLFEQEGAAAPRGERWVIETYEPGRADIRPCDGGIRVA
jgi:Hemopexin/Putative peptidoglycan binding domain/Beta-lactamase enzyme family